MGFATFLKFIYFYVVQKDKLVDNENDSKLPRWLMYMSTIIEHMLHWLDLILIDLMQFVVLTKNKMHYSKGKVLMNSNVWNEWYDDKKKHKVKNKLNNDLLIIKKYITQFLNSYICNTFLYDII